MCCMVRMAALAVLAGAQIGHASVTRGEPLNGEPTSAFLAVGEVGVRDGYDGCGTAVFGGQYVLTAAHLVTTNGQLYPASDVTFRLGGISYAVSSILSDFGADLALLRLTSTSLDYAQLYTGQADQRGQVFAGVGYGQTDADGNGSWGPGGNGVKRVFQNIVDDVMTSPIPGQGVVLRYDFDKTSGDSLGNIEGLHGPGDSGGGLFLWNGAEYQLAGVLSSSGDPINAATGSAVDILPYASLLSAAVPEPSGLAILAAGFIPLLRRRRN